MGSSRSLSGSPFRRGERNRLLRTEGEVEKSNRRSSKLPIRILGQQDSKAAEEALHSSSRNNRTRRIDTRGNHKEIQQRNKTQWRYAVGSLLVVEKED